MPYVSLKVAFGKPTSSSTSISSTSIPGFEEYYKNNKELNSLRVAAGVKLFDALRTELELGMNTGTRVSWDDIENSTFSNALLVNAYYDFDTHTGFKPYIGAGIGIAELEYKNEDWITGLVFKDKGTNFAYQFGAGVSYDFNKHFSLDVGYRYTNYGVFKKATTALGGVEDVKTALKTNDISVGFRVLF